jgi:menaquinone-dependent protoporphyrinogen IX oxidase
MKGLIVYQSQYGSTETYAHWIAEDTGYDAVSYQSIARKDLESAERIILGCSVISGKPKLADWIQEHWDILKDKRPLLFTTSGAVPSDPVLINNYKNAFPPEIQKILRYHPSVVG